MDRSFFAQGNQYKLVLTLSIIERLVVSDTQWLRSSVRGLIGASKLCQASMDFHKFRFKESVCL